MSSPLTTGNRTDDYILGRTSEEHERLRKQARHLEPLTARVLDRLALRPGMSCLDVGCGPGEVMRLLSERAGPTGKVVGLDPDGKLGRESLAFLHAQGYSQCSFVEGDLDTANISGQFDLVFARLLLHHLPDSVAGIRAMFGLVKPGGCLAVQDYTFQAIDHHPPCAVMMEFLRVFAEVYKRSGREFRSGVKLPAYFREAGLGAPDGTDVGGSLVPAAESLAMVGGVYRSVLPAAYRLGVTTEAESAAVLAEIQSASEGDAYFLWPLTISAWKIKPV